MKRISILLLACLLMLACVPTPEEEPIINQASDTNHLQKMESIEDVPERWQETVEQNNVMLIFQAEVAAPNTLSLQKHYYEPRIFSQSEVDKIVDYFAQGKALYLFPSELTKADYEKMYLDALQGTEVDGEYVITEDAEKLIKELQERILSAPEEGGKKYTDSTLTFDVNLNGRDVTPGGKNFLSVSIDSGKHEDATLGIRNYVSGYQNYSLVRYDKGSLIYTESLLSGTDPTGSYVELSDEEMSVYQSMMDGISISLETVDKDAQQIMQELDLPQMKRMSAEKAILFSYEGTFGVDSTRLPVVGWWVTYMRDYGDCPCLSNISIYLNQRNDEVADYSAPVNIESIQVFISNEGLERFYYTGALSEDAAMAEDVDLLSFSKIQDIAKKHLYYQQAFSDDNPDMKKEITINSMELKYVFVREKNSESRLCLLPAWVLSGQCKYLLNGAEIINEDASLVINAENGGIILFGNVNEK